MAHPWAKKWTNLRLMYQLGKPLQIWLLPSIPCKLAFFGIYIWECRGRMCESIRGWSALLREEDATHCASPHSAHGLPKFPGREESENRSSQCGARGSVNQKVEPWPTSLSTPTSP